MFFQQNIVPVYKKGDHQCVLNYRPVSVLPVFSKIFERLIYKAMFNHFLDNNLISCKQFSFNFCYPCINQLIEITHNILKGFHDGLEISGIFLDISKTFSKVCHEGLIYNLHCKSICGNLVENNMSC